VPKYDAFGREIGDDPLKEFRPSEPVTPQAAPVAAAEQPPPQQQRLRFRRPRRRRRGGLARLIVILAILGAGALVIGNASVSIESGIDDIVGSLPETADPDPQVSATGIKGASLIRRANFENAVAALSGAGLGRLITMRVAPDRIDATLIGRGGRLRQIQITADGELRELATSDGAASRTIAYEAIDPAAPERLVRAGATKGSPARGIDYLVVSAGPPLSWGAYYKGGRIVLGDAHGRKQRVISPR
jgi:hypothetical protein